ncbi:MAG: type II toxin-antitoxin system PemK/MazF family toxin [Planctomycetales bacterium]
MANPLRGEIWQADLNPTRGREQAGRRPVLVVSTDPFNEGPAELVVVLPITSKRKGIPWHVGIAPPEGGLRTASYIMCEAVRCVARERLAKRMGEAAPATMRDVEDRLRILLEL